MSDDLRETVLREIADSHTESAADDLMLAREMDDLDEQRERVNRAAAELEVAQFVLEALSDEGTE
jgi:hypothetical protein